MSAGQRNGVLRGLVGPGERWVQRCSGWRLMPVAHPSPFGDASMSRQVRDALHAVSFAPDVSGTSADTDDTGVTASEARAPDTGARASDTGARPNALLRQPPDPAIARAEGALLTEWPNRLSNAPHDR
ncbi:hypothetical protein ACIOHC_16690 [Streptomyces sp. NPDC088252]|uniref:hypothetical protein n=1 Tax=Streptomyces sp. NPDC088252 TaxID=3365845 RepID=UPI0037FE517B